jgi:hypothetical protein
MAHISDNSCPFWSTETQTPCGVNRIISRQSQCDALPYALERMQSASLTLVGSVVQSHGIIPPNSSARRFLTYWNVCSPLPSLLLEAPSRVMELPSPIQSARFLLTHWNEFSPLSSLLFDAYYGDVSASRCHLLYRLILAEMQCNSILIRCSKGQEEKIDFMSRYYRYRALNIYQ